jgi:hypothetical protein
LPFAAGDGVSDVTSIEQANGERWLWFLKVAKTSQCGENVAKTASGAGGEEMVTGGETFSC